MSITIQFIYGNEYHKAQKIRAAKNLIMQPKAASQETCPQVKELARDEIPCLRDSVCQTAALV
jgi:hypothetical protein